MDNAQHSRIADFIWGSASPALPDSEPVPLTAGIAPIMALETLPLAPGPGLTGASCSSAAELR